MKKSGFSVVFAVRLVVTLLIVVFIIFSIIFFTECQLPLIGNLFDKRVLKKYNVSWLEKPQNVMNESQYVVGRYYLYECEIDDIEEFERYSENVFNSFYEKNYTVAHYVESVNAMLNGSYCVVAESGELSDYCKTYDESVRYVFYYSMKTVQEMEKSNLAKKFGDRNLEIRFLKRPNENGRFDMEIWLFAGKQKISNIIYES